MCSDLLPQQNDKPTPTVKMDHLLQFNPGHRHPAMDNNLSGTRNCLRSFLIYLLHVSARSGLIARRPRRLARSTIPRRTLGSLPTTLETLELPCVLIHPPFQGSMQVCKSVDVIGRYDKDRGMQQNFASARRWRKSCPKTPHSQPQCTSPQFYPAIAKSLPAVNEIDVILLEEPCGLTTQPRVSFDRYPYEHRRLKV